MGYTVLFLSQSLQDSLTHNDRRYVESLFGKKYRITRTLAETLSAYEQVDLLVGMRLHAMILAAHSGIPIIPISYGPKTDAMIDILGIDEYRIDSKGVTFERFFSIFALQINNFKKEQEKISQQYREVHTKCLQKIQKTAIFEE